MLLSAARAGQGPPLLCSAIVPLCSPMLPFSFLTTR